MKQKTKKIIRKSGKVVGVITLSGIAYMIGGEILEDLDIFDANPDFQIDDISEITEEIVESISIIREYFEGIEFEAGTESINDLTTEPF